MATAMKLFDRPQSPSEVNANDMRPQIIERFEDSNRAGDGYTR